MFRFFKLGKSLLLSVITLLMLTATALAAPAELTLSLHPIFKEINIPTVTIPDNPKATAAINAEIKKEIDDFIDFTADCWGEAEDWNPVTIGNTYEIGCNDDEILSLRFMKYINIERAAHPMYYIHGLNFNPQTGERITIDSINEAAVKKDGKPAYTKEDVTKKLQAMLDTDKNLGLYENSLPLSSMPQFFYFDEKHHIHFIFQPYDIAPFASGAIDVDMESGTDGIRQW